MAIDNIKTSIQSLTGVEAANTDFIENAQRFVVQSSPKNLLRFAISASAGSIDGSAIPYDRNDSIIDVQRNGYSCREIPFSESAWANDSNSLKKASVKFPVWWSQSDGIKIAPSTTSSAGAGYIHFVDYNKIDDDTDLRNAVVLHASASEFTKLATGTVGSWDTINIPVSPSSPDFGSDLTISSEAPVSPSNPSFTYVDASVSDIIQPIISISDKTALVADNPSYTKPVLSLTATPNITDLTISAVVPSSVDAPSFNIGSFTVGESLPSYTKPVFSVPTLAAVGSLTLPSSPPSPSVDLVSTGTVSDVPNYIAPVFSAPTLESINPFSIRSAPVAPESPNFTYEDASVGDILFPIARVSNMASLSANAPTYVSPVVTLTAFPSLTWNLPERPVAPIIESQTVGDFTSQAPSYIAPVLSLEDAPSITSLSISAIPPTSPSLSSSAVGTVSGAPTFTPPVMTDLDYTDADNWIDTEEDSEMLQARVSVINSKIQEFQTRLGESIGAFNKANSIYQTNLQVAVETAKLDSQDDAQKIQSFGNEVTIYQADVNKEVEQFQINFQKELQIWQVGRQTSIQKYSADIQSALNDFNEEQALFQATVQKKLKEADLLNSHEANKLQRFQHELGAFQSTTTKIVSSNQAECACWQQESAILIQNYTAHLQDSINVFNKENITYQEDIQRKVQNLGKDLSIAVENAKNEIAANSANMQKSVQISMQNSVQNAQVNVEEYNAKLGRYGSEVQSYQAEVNIALQKWTAEEWTQKFQKYNTDYSLSMQTYQADIQNALNVFNKENILFQKNLQVALQDAQLQESEEGRKLQKYNAEIQQYQVDIEATIQKWKVEEWDQNFQKYNLDYTSKLQEYTADIQNELNVFNKEQASYQLVLQEKMEEAKNQQTKDASEYAAKIQKYSAEVQSYQADVNQQIQEYTVNEVQKEIGIWSQNIQSDLQGYSADIQNELNNFNKGVVIYQEDIARKTENLQKDIQQAIKNADSELQSKSANLQKETQIALQNAMNGYKEDVDEYASNLQRYSADIQNYQQNVNKEAQNYVNSLNKKVQEYQSKMALYSAEVQKYQIDISEQTQDNTLKTQNVAYYSKESDRCYQMAVAEVQRYIANNEKMIQQTIAAQAAQG